MHSVRENLCNGLDECDKVNGCYRDIEDLLVKLAKFYLNHGKYNLLTFDQPNIFHIALGGDGAPFGRDDSACSCLSVFSLVSFIGQGVLSSNENFLLFGANCAENCLPVKRFLGKLMTDIKQIQSSSYSILAKGESIDVKFVFAELPNDMKMLAFLAGELTNSATYFSTFADVDKESLTKIGTFGHNASDTWKPWKYSDRVKVVNAVEKFKKKIKHKNVSANTKRSNITSFIAKQKSRQEVVPLVAELVDRAHVEPLHLKNNVCALAHRYLLNQAIEMCKPHLSTSFSQVPPETPFFKFIDVLRSKCNLNRLAKRIIRWYDDNAKTDARTFNYRFTGKDSRMFLHNFMFLINVLENGASGKAAELLHVHAYLCLCLRNAVSLFSRVNITDEQILELKQHCTNFYRGYWLFFSVNPTVWTLGCVVPVHTQEMKKSYGLGLGLNSMEGREAKHIAISKYCINTVYAHRWEQVFHHEYISLIWLRTHGYTNVSINSSSTGSTLSYLPKRVCSKDPNYCVCGMQKVASVDLCRFCGHGLRKKIEKSIEICKSIFKLLMSTILNIYTV